MRFRFVLYLVITLVVAFSWLGPQSSQREIQIGERIFKVAVASNEDSWRRGLSGQALCSDCGMLFDFGKELPNLEFWMRGMLIDLDMLWLDSSGHEVYRAENVPRPECLSVDACPPARRSIDRPARYVLELPAGTLATLKGNPLSVTLGTLGP